MDANISLESQFTTEYRLLEEYCSIRKPKPRLLDRCHSRGKHTPRSAPAVTPMCAAPQLMKRRKLKSSNRGLEERRGLELLETDSLEDTDEGVADNLVQIVDSAPLVQDEVVSDGDYVIQRLVELLKESGDELNEKIQKDHVLVGYLQSSFSYSVFEKLASTFIGSPMPSQRQNQNAGEQKKQIAWTFEMTSRLTALDLQPMNRAMGFGAQYLHQNFAQWIQQNGGWEKVFKRDESDDV